MIPDDDSTSTARPFYHVPVSTDEFKPTRPVELTTLAKNFLKEYYGELRPFLTSIAGETASITGHPRMDEAAMTFKAQELASANGYPELGKLLADPFRLLLRRAYRSHTDTPIGALMHQGIRLRIEYRRAEKEAEQDAEQDAE